VQTQAKLSLLCLSGAVITSAIALNGTFKAIQQVATTFSRGGTPSAHSLPFQMFLSIALMAKISEALWIAAIVFAVWAMVNAFLRKNDYAAVYNGSFEASVYYGAVDRRSLNAGAGATVATDQGRISQANKYNHSFNTAIGPEHFAAAEAIAAYVASVGDNPTERQRACQIQADIKNATVLDPWAKSYLRPKVEELVSMAERTAPIADTVVRSLELLKSAFF
jgi:hypothetical protein